MRHRSIIVVPTLALGALLAGCAGDTSPSGAALVTITGEELETVPGDLCAVQGHATNSGNVRARVRLRYEARDGSGGVLGTSVADFEVAPFSAFRFEFAKGNGQGQPSSAAFTNGLACRDITDFKRVDTDVDQA